VILLDEDNGSKEISMDGLVAAHEAIDNLSTPLSDDYVSNAEVTSDDERMGFDPSSVPIKYRTEAQVPKNQEKFFDQYQGSYGRHVALSNTKRMDNVRHLNALDLQYIYDRIPTLRQRGNEIRVRETSEYQMCRSNQETGGFEAKLGVTNIRRENVDVKQAQSLFSADDGKKKKKGMLNFLRR
jgi:hypothetical protein